MITPGLIEIPKAVMESPLSGHGLETLLRPEAFVRERTTRVELRETHISWVFLTDRFAYKIKKSVRFDFLDFSSAAQRREACENEVKLNRRLAPGIYLGVVPVTTAPDGDLSIDGQGDVVDWAVKMRRLPSDAALDALVIAGGLTATHISLLAEKLANFYERLPPVTITTGEYRARIERHVIANRQELLATTHHLDRACIERIHAAQLRMLKLAPQWFDARVCDGRIVEGHGDLRPEHIYLTPEPLIIDCIEFSREFRTLDVLDELAFLAMECEALGAAQLAQPILTLYGQQSGDHPAPQLLAFYQSYRACVRAKVCALQAHALTGSAHDERQAQAERYLELAERYARQLGPSLVIVVRGLSGAGKSTLATMLSEQLDWPLWQTDVVRQQLFGQHQDQVGYNQGRYQADQRAQVYHRMLELCEEKLRDGLSVVLDGTFLDTESRRAVQDLAQRYAAEAIVVHCHCPEPIAAERIIARLQAGESPSEARPEFLEKQRQSEQPDPPGLASLQLDTSQSDAAPLHTALDYLRKFCFPDQASTPNNRQACS